MYVLNMRNPMHPLDSTWNPYGWALNVVSLFSVSMTPAYQLESEMQFIIDPMIHKGLNIQ